MASTTCKDKRGATHIREAAGEVSVAVEKWLLIIPVIFTGSVFVAHPSLLILVIHVIFKIFSLLPSIGVYAFFQRITFGFVNFLPCSFVRCC